MVYLAQTVGDGAVKSQVVWLLSVSFLLMCGVIGCREKPQPIVVNRKTAVEKPKEIVAKPISEPDTMETRESAIEEAVAAQKEDSQRLGAPVEITNSIGMRLKLIPAGEFLMGDERSRHKVRITKPFYLGVYEVTQAEYERVVGENPSGFSKQGHYADLVTGMDTSSYPVEMVFWGDTMEFCKRLSAKEGKTYRLPTEAEWEYACRAGTTTPYCFGDDPEGIDEYAWYENNSDHEVHPVGEKKPNAWGLHDMHGNVWEWCADWHGSDYYAVSPTDDPPGPETGSSRVDRGGSWKDPARRCVSSDRGGNVPSRRFSDLGFRVVAVRSGK